MRFETLSRNREFQELYQRGRSHVGRFAVLYLLPREDGRSRVGFTVGRKIGGAVERNRVRRRLKEIYRLLRPELKEGYDLVIVARGRAKNVPYRLLEGEIKTLLHKAGLLAKEEAGRSG